MGTMPMVPAFTMGIRPKASYSVTPCMKIEVDFLVYFLYTALELLRAHREPSRAPPRSEVAGRSCQHCHLRANSVLPGQGSGSSSVGTLVILFSDVTHIWQGKQLGRWDS